ASGIGRGVVIKLVAEGASVAVLDVNLEAAEQVAREAGGEAIAIRANVADESAVDKAIALAEDRFGGLDTIIANAGVMLFDRDTVATELSLETCQKSIDINLTGMFLTCKHGLRALQRNGS